MQLENPIGNGMHAKEYNLQVPPTPAQTPVSLQQQHPESSCTETEALRERKINIFTEGPGFTLKVLVYLFFFGGPENGCMSMISSISY